MRRQLVKKLSWDSKHFGFPIARLEGRKLSASKMIAARRACLKNKIKCLYLTVGSDDPESIRQAEKNGFELIGVRQSFELSEPRKLAKGIGKMDEKVDPSELKKMSWLLYRDSRFYRDGRFPPKRVDEMFGLWAAKLKTFVFRERREIIGFVGWSSSGKKVRIELFGVHPLHQGKGIGKKLLARFLSNMRHKGYSHFETVTQGSNIPAIRVYEYAGFRINETQLDYHKWF